MTEKQKRFNELSNRAFEREYAVYSEFLGIAEISELSSMHLNSPITLWGGFEGAERVVACFGNRDYFADNSDFPVKCIKISPLNQKFADKLSHRDFLGSLMGLGLRREVLGDIIVNENCGCLFCLETVSGFIIDNLIQVKHTSVKCEITEDVPEDVLPVPVSREFTVSSERLDAVVAGVCKLSRSKASDLIAGEKIFVNGILKTNASFSLKSGDKVTVRGFGRFVFTDLERNTKKNRKVIRADIFGRL